MYRIAVLKAVNDSHPAAELVTDVAAADAIVSEDHFPTINSAMTALILRDVELICGTKDACYDKVKATYKAFPSARASQAIAKCRKATGHVTKSEKGASLRRWEKEKWQDKITKKECGHEGGPEYCRPTKKISSKTPKMYKGEKLKEKIRLKRTTGHA